MNSLPGWIEDKEAVSEIASGLDFPTFSTTGAFSLESVPTEVFGWKLHESLVGGVWPSRDQGQVGSCVSFGTCAAIEFTMLAEISRLEPEAYKPLVQEVVYGGSRVEIGKGRISGDGSVGAWAAKFVTNYGVVSRGIYGKNDLSVYNESRCREYGRVGVPDDLEVEARKHPINSITLVESADQAVKALASGYGISICSNQGFTKQRDKNGFAAPQGRWGHCMAAIGYQLGERPGIWICNSWGERYHTGPVGNGNPPVCGFWADMEIVDKMLGLGDSWAFSSFLGFPKKMIDWKI
ncbi:Peptidase C1A, papain C-terminal [uncultured Caudovirales phage]|uniref:Peptidase C1A, papain C-terminal n=1 Tax=uncultured Caudovirales phage TaxID=2100421 RepID=A0A6J5NTW4_9CAUD|nr:Peptidase C1A, papain C-terminal [uncultured Caudovirales phage]